MRKFLAEAEKSAHGEKYIDKAMREKIEDNMVNVNKIVETVHKMPEQFAHMIHQGNEEEDQDEGGNIEEAGEETLLFDVNFAKLNETCVTYSDIFEPFERIKAVLPLQGHPMDIVYIRKNDLGPNGPSYEICIRDIRYNGFKEELAIKGFMES